MNHNSLKIIFCVAITVISITGCTQETLNKEAFRKEIILATTTSTYDSGLLDELLPVFERETGIIVKTISVGTGKALSMGREGNADVLLVHAPEAELEFINQGYGIERKLVMHNDFVFVGPTEDPAEVAGLKFPPDVLTAIAKNQALFISRGDDSGTHKKEKAFWQEAGLEPKGEWYIESGQGMGATLQIAAEKQGYSLTDRATFLSLKDVLELEILSEGALSLLNIYHVMIVNPERRPEINLEAARAFSDFLLSPQAQNIIAEFGKEQFEQPLFIPDAGKSDSDFEE